MAKQGRQATRRRADSVRRVALVRIAHARRGDTGDTAKIGLIALKPKYYPLLVEQVMLRMEIPAPRGFRVG
jgi:hypothetical protein